MLPAARLIMNAMRVLLIEDYQPLRESVARGLREAGFAVDAVGDGRERLSCTYTCDYDVIVLDLLVRAGLLDQFDRSLVDKACTLASTIEQEEGKVDLEFEITLVLPPRTVCE
jgi:CheY-like chemotaxis protein